MGTNCAGRWVGVLQPCCRAGPRAHEAQTCTELGEEPDPNLTHRFSTFMQTAACLKCSNVLQACSVPSEVNISRSRTEISMLLAFPSWLDQWLNWDVLSAWGEFYQCSAAQVETQGNTSRPRRGEGAGHVCSGASQRSCYFVTLVILFACPTVSSQKEETPGWKGREKPEITVPALAFFETEQGTLISLPQFPCLMK